MVENFQKFVKSGKITEKRRQSQFSSKEFDRFREEDVQENNNQYLKINENNNETNSNTNLITTNLVLTEDNNIDEMICCNKIEKSPLTSLNHLTVDVGAPIIINGGFFNSNYAVYTVKCPIIHTEVTRRFRDFDWLRNELKHFFPGIFVRK